MKSFLINNGVKSHELEAPSSEIMEKSWPGILETHPNELFLIAENGEEFRTGPEIHPNPFEGRRLTDEWIATHSDYPTPLSK